MTEMISFGRMIGLGMFILSELMAIDNILKDKESLDALKSFNLRRCKHETLILIAFVPLSSLLAVLHIVCHGLVF